MIIKKSPIVLTKGSTHIILLGDRVYTATNAYAAYIRITLSVKTANGTTVFFLSGKQYGTLKRDLESVKSKFPSGTYMLLRVALHGRNDRIVFSKSASLSDSKKVEALLNDPIITHYLRTNQSAKSVKPRKRETSGQSLVGLF